jgi:hypothetical protein
MKTRGLPLTPVTVLVLLSGLVAGCGVTHQWIYDKPGLMPESFDRDRGACRATSPPTGLTALLNLDDVDREAFTRCMRQLGYTGRREML